jgi:hypothetical protein
MKGDDNRLAIFKQKVIRNNFGPVYNTELGIFERRKIDDLYRLYLKSNVSLYKKIKRI